MEYKVIRVVLHASENVADLSLSPIDALVIDFSCVQSEGQMIKRRVLEKRLGRSHHRHTTASVLSVQSNIIDRAAARFTFLHSSVIVINDDDCADGGKPDRCLSISSDRHPRLLVR